MERNDIIKVYDKMLKAYEEECKTGLRYAIYPDGPEPVEKQISFQPMFSDEDIENVKQHSFDNIDTCLKFIVFYSFYILTEPEISDILDFIKEECDIDLAGDSDFIKRIQQYSNEIV